MVAMQDVKGEDYTVYVEPDTSTVLFQGELSLDGPTEYAPIADLLNKVVETEPNTMTLDLRNLGYVNSSGISMLYKFVLSMQKKKGVQFNLNFFVDDIRLENGRRGDRVSSQIYEEVVRYLKQSATKVIESNATITLQSENTNS